MLFLINEGSWVFRKFFKWSRKQLEASLLPIEGQRLKQAAGTLFQTAKFCVSLSATLALAPLLSCKTSFPSESRVRHLWSFLRILSGMKNLSIQPR